MFALETTQNQLPLYDQAVKNLSAFVVERAKETAHAKGFGWIAKPNAPDTFIKLRAAHRFSERTGTPMPVSSLYCDNVIYTEPSINYAMRFWHDTLHIGTDLTFSLDDELELGLHHLGIAERHGIRKHSTEWEMLRVDLLGQNYLLGIAKRFPLDQADFVRGCLLYGLDEGVLREARKSE